jgi:hypothetical protein
MRDLSDCREGFRIDETCAVEPLEQTSLWDAAESPETYPFKV